MDFLSDIQRDALRATLIQRQRELQGQLAHSEEGAKPVDLASPIGRLSRMDAMQQQQMTQASKRIAEQRLLQIAAALLRMDEESYGYCVECDEEISLARLKARPESPFCVTCQDSREKR